jgi:hypothetical protein
LLLLLIALRDHTPPVQTAAAKHQRAAAALDANDSLSLGLSEEDCKFFTLSR